MEIISLDFFKRDTTTVPKGMTAGAQAFLDKPPDGVYGLREDNVFLKKLLELPTRKGVTYHSIVGVKGGGNPEEGSDGVVPYASAHLDAAVSETVVDASHTEINKNAEAIEEVRRILYLHLGERYLPPSAKGGEGSGR
jgi:hypothetical protein